MSEHKNNAFLRFSTVLGGQPPKPIEDMTEEEMNLLLMSGGTHVLKLEQRWAEFLKRGEKELALDAASERRTKILSTASQSIERGSAIGADLLSRAMDLVAVLRMKDPEQAAIFARKFEETTPEDIESLALEVAILEGAAQQDEDPDRGDQG